MVDTSLPCDEKGFQGAHKKMFYPVAHSLHMSHGPSCWQYAMAIALPDNNK